MAHELVEGTIASAPDADGRVTVTVPEFAGDQAIGPCPYQLRGDIAPAPGDLCLVALADSSSTALSWVVVYEH